MQKKRLNIKYYDNYKYQLGEDAHINLPIYGEEYESDFIKITRSGDLFIRKGYAWDGSTGAKDTKKTLPASLVHDALCQLINEGMIDKKWQLTADLTYRAICLGNGFGNMRTAIRYRAIRCYDDSGLKEYKPREILTAP